MQRLPAGLGMLTSRQLRAWTVRVRRELRSPQLPQGRFRCRHGTPLYCIAVLGRGAFAGFLFLCVSWEGPCLEVERELFLNTSAIGHHLTNHPGDSSRNPIHILFNSKICLSATLRFIRNSSSYLCSKPFIPDFSSDYSALFSTSVHF